MSASPIRLRTGTGEDAAAVLAVWQAAGAVPSVTDDVGSLRRLVERDADALIVAEDDGVVVGSVIAGWDGWRGNLYRLAVRPDHRRRGIARALVAEAERRLRASGAARNGAIVVSEHDDAVRLWTSVGYERDPRVARFVKTLGP